MLRYKNKPRIVEAEIYRLGLEDGFDSMGLALSNHLMGGYMFPYCVKGEMGVPYILDADGLKHYIREGMWVVIDEETKEKQIMTGKMFKRRFEPL